jgi:dolichol-phosphate mannosyltransferase
LKARYDYSLVIPCYNEEEALGRSIPPLRARLKELGLNAQLVLVNNGSRDRTGDILDAWAAQDSDLRVVHLRENRKYGGGVLAGYAVAEGRICCHLCADGQIGERDVARVLLALDSRGPGTMAKAWRVKSHEGLFRQVSSRICRMLFRLCFGRITPDVNATPKAFFREDLAAMDLGCVDDFLDGEIMIKADRLGMKVIEIPCEFLPRVGGVSKVSQNFLSHFALYVRQLAAFRFGGRLNSWKERIECRRPNVMPSSPTSCTSPEL